MRKSRFQMMNWMALFIIALMFSVPSHTLAFKAPDEDPSLNNRHMRDNGIKKSKDDATAAPKLGLTSIVNRDVNQFAGANSFQRARDIVEDLLNSESGRSLSAGHDRRVAGTSRFSTQLRKTQIDNLGYEHMRLTQHYLGIPVVGAEFVVHINKKGFVYQVNGKYLAKLDISVEPSINADEALKIGLDEMQGISVVDVSRKPALVIYAQKLAYFYVLSHDEPIVAQWRYYVDAQTGELIYRYNNIQQAAPNQGSGSHTTVNGNRLVGEDGAAVGMLGFKETVGNYFMYNFDYLWGVYDSAAGDWEQQATSNWLTTDRHAVSCGHNFELIQDYVINVMGRNSFDDAGAFGRANVHETGDLCPVNAWWDGTDWHFCDGDAVNSNELCVLDVAAHEYGHAITDYTSNLVYSYESGALNESYSDILASTVEFNWQVDGTAPYPNSNAGQADWLMGEDTWLPAGTSALRDMSNPIRLGQPSYYKGTNWYFGSGDNGGVHTNSGVQNFAYYLLAVGGSGTNDGHAYGPITGIGEAAAAAVAMRANMVYHISSDQYADARDHWISAASDLGYSTATVEAVWEACGVGAPPLPCDIPYDYDDTVPYAFEDISATGTDLLLPDDGYAHFSIPFTFNYYCNDYTEVSVGSNGTVYFEDIYLGWENVCIPGTNGYLVDTFIAPFWDDLDPSAAGAVYYEVKGTTPSRRLIVQWQDVPRWGIAGDATFQVILYESSDEILFQYADVDFGNAAYDYGASVTVGLQESSSNGVQYSCNSALLSNGLAILFTPQKTSCHLINDGSFEYGPPPASGWTEWSSNGDEKIIDPTGVWGIGAYDGTYAFWAGGYFNGIPNSDYVEQSISIPADASSLKFMTNFYRPDADDAATNDYFYVKINGATVFTKAMTQANDTYPDWADQSVDISSYAGTTVTLRFEGVSVGDGSTDYTGNVLVDSIQICGAPDELAVDFGASGLWNYDGSGSWSKLSNSNVQWLAGSEGQLIADFGGSGMYAYNGTTWVKITTGNADNGGNTMIVYNGGLAVDFGASGLYFYNGTSWTSLSPTNVQWLTFYSGKLVADFGSYGTYEYDGATWTKITTGNPDNGGNTMIAYNGGLAVDFGASGLYFYDGTSWTSLSPTNVQWLSTYGDKLVADFGASGMYEHGGTMWVKITTGNADNSGNTMIGW